MKKDKVRQTLKETVMFVMFFCRRWRPRVEDVTQVADAPEAEAQRRRFCQQLSGQSLFPAAADPFSPADVGASRRLLRQIQENKTVVFSQRHR